MQTTLEAFLRDLVDMVDRLRRKRRDMMVQLRGGGEYLAREKFAGGCASCDRKV